MTAPAQMVRKGRKYDQVLEGAREVFMAAHGGDPVPPVDTRRGDLEALLPDASEEPVAEGEEFEDL